MPIDYLRVSPAESVELPALPDGSPCRHEFDAESIGAVNAALAAGRPLLVRGEPGLGKTQLAEAAAVGLQRAYLPYVVDSRTEHRDLLWRFDAVRRLAAAQLAPFQGPAADPLGPLAERKFVRPGPVWWALNWESAARALRESAATPGDCENPLELGENARRKENGWVLLIDEIDKAESDVPNGLLEVLGSQRFTPFGTSVPVAASGRPPLVVVTTNEERTLPAAFLRRCLVLTMELPQEERPLVELLVRRGNAHFGDRTSEPILRLAARQLWKDRKEATDRHVRPRPGQAEYLDLIRVVVNRHPGDPLGQAALLETASKYLFKKHGH
ncbi:MAG TPA: MoxR family ATPase [Urbifossiella sp.]|jgi:MoxR-like ATPase|nr:MoxR family ATPase [Urbifossiella sp.]